MRLIVYLAKRYLLLIKMHLCLITSLPVQQQDIRSELVAVVNETDEGFAYESGGRKIAQGQINEQSIIKILLKDYDWRVRPHGLNESWSDTGGPVIITVNMLMRSISKIDDVNMEYSAQFTFREEWIDPRLAYAKILKNMSLSAQPKFVILVPDDKAQQIWIPDSFFQNEKTANRHFVDKPNIMIRIYPNGEILYSVRLSMTLSCQMNLINYPLDSQMCYIEMASYAYTTDDIMYVWNKTNPIQLKNTVNNSLPSFELEDVKVEYCSSKTTTGEYSCLRTELYLKRLFSYYLVHLYIPSFLLVVVSWVSFWLDKTSAPARVTLGITTLLTMTTQASGINAKLPPVSYTKAIDIWIGVCLAFIFGALLEFALVNYAFNELCNKEKMKPFKTKKCKANLILNWQDNDKIHDTIISRSPLFPMQDSVVWKRRSSEMPTAANYIYVDTIHSIERKKRAMSLHYFIKWLKMLKNEYKDRAKLIDLISRIMFPLLFFSFNMCYWVIYL